MWRHVDQLGRYVVLSPAPSSIASKGQAISSNCPEFLSDLGSPCIHLSESTIINTDKLDKTVSPAVQNKGDSDPPMSPAFTDNIENITPMKLPLHCSTHQRFSCAHLKEFIV